MGRYRESNRARGGYPSSSASAEDIEWWGIESLWGYDQMRYCRNYYPQIFFGRWVPLDSYGLDKELESALVELDRMRERDGWPDWVDDTNRDIVIRLDAENRSGKGPPAPTAPAAASPALLSPAPQSVAQRSVGKLEGPTITNVVGDSQGIVRITFSEPVVVYGPDGVKLATTNAGALNLYLPAGTPPACPARADTYAAPTGPTTASRTLCFAAPTGIIFDSESFATQFIIGRGSSIRDSDDNTAVTAFVAVNLL